MSSALSLPLSLCLHLSLPLLSLNFAKCLLHCWKGQCQISLATSLYRPDVWDTWEQQRNDGPQALWGPRGSREHHGSRMHGFSSGRVTNEQCRWWSSGGTWADCPPKEKKVRQGQPEWEPQPMTTKRDGRRKIREKEGRQARKQNSANPFSKAFF